MRHLQFPAAPDVEPPEPLEELPEIFHGRVPEDLGLAVM
jgi:hypothetical protein